jgi:hypothetical protein
MRMEIVGFEILTRGKRVSKLSFWISRQVAVRDDF